MRWGGGGGVGVCGPCDSQWQRGFDVTVSELTLAPLASPRCGGFGMATLALEASLPSSSGHASSVGLEGKGVYVCVCVCACGCDIINCYQRLK